MSGTNNSNDIVNNHIQTQDTSYSIEVCKGPDCTGLGGGAAILEIEELVREHRHQNGDDTIRVVAGGCRDFCSVGPNVHIHARRPNESGKRTNLLLESFQGVNDASSCNRVLDSIIASKSTSEEAAEYTPCDSSSAIDRHRSMMARKAERQRWEALKDVSRTIAKCQKTIPSTSDDEITRKQKVWKETFTDRLELCNMSMGRSQGSARERRRVQHLVEIASETLDRICLQNDDESDSSSYTSSSSEE